MASTEGNGKGSVHNTIQLGEVWKRLNSLCLKLWQEDRVAAVGLQAIIEEFRGEIARAEQLLSGLEHALTEQRRTIELAMETKHGQDRNKWLDQAKAIEGRILALEETLRMEKNRGDELLKEVERAERALDDYKEQAIKREAELDLKHAEKQRELYDQLQKKEATEESFWVKQRGEWEEERKRQLQTLEDKEGALESRAKQMEMTYQQKIAEIQKKYETLLGEVKNRSENLEHQHNQKGSELVSTYGQLKKDIETREVKLAGREEAIRQKEGAVEERTRELEAAYKKKNQDLDNIKEELRSEVTKIVNEYRARQSQTVS